MGESRTTRVTGVLNRVAEGDSAASDELLALVYDELRAEAARYFRRQSQSHTFQPTDVVHEAYLKLVANPDAEWSGRRHFFSVAAKAMRQVLINHARERRSQKRGGGWKRITINSAIAGIGSQDIDVLELDELLQRLAELSERQAKIVELRIFGGLTLQETADFLDVGVTTVKDDWQFARAWLKRELLGREGSGG